MLVESVELRNFRCVRNAVLECKRFTSLVGANGVGKSTFLRGLEMFYDPNPKVSVEDFYASDPSLEVTIAVKYGDLGGEASSLFDKYVVNGSLSVERVFTIAGGKVTARYHGAVLRHRAFQELRAGLEIKDRGKTARSRYEMLRKTPTYESLPEWTTLGDVSAALSAWEAAHPDACTRERDDGQFFGFSTVAQGYLGRFTRLLFIPAVREAAVDATESRGSVLSALMDLAVRSALTSKPAYQRLQARTKALYDRIVDPEKLAELQALQDGLSAALQVYVPDASVSLNWRPVASLELPMPSADVKVVESEYEASIDRSGHGLQRAFIMTILHQLSSAQSNGLSQSADPSPAAPSIVLAIEEPELYQHPSRQRHIAKALVRLATAGIPGVTRSTQIICATHSPLFVSIDRVDEIRLLRRENQADSGPKAASVVSTSLTTLADVIWRADGQPQPQYTATTLLPRMRTVMNPWVNEGFFADVVVLVEGEDDRAALLGTAAALGIEIDGRGFAILPCGGKTCLDRPYAVFSQLGIPSYVVWDGDKGRQNAVASDNRRLLRLLNQPEVDWPSEVAEQFACFEVDLETTMETEIGSDLYRRLLRERQAELGIPKEKHARKNPTVVARLLEEAIKLGATSETLAAVVKSVAALR